MKKVVGKRSDIAIIQIAVSILLLAGAAAMLWLSPGFKVGIFVMIIGILLFLWSIMLIATFPRNLIIFEGDKVIAYETRANVVEFLASDVKSVRIDSRGQNNLIYDMTFVLKGGRVVVVRYLYNAHTVYNELKKLRGEYNDRI